MKRAVILALIFLPSLCNALSYECDLLAGAYSNSKNVLVLDGFGDTDIGFVYTADSLSKPTIFDSCVAVRSCNTNSEDECWSIYTSVYCSRTKMGKKDVIYSPEKTSKHTLGDFNTVRNVAKRKSKTYGQEIYSEKKPFRSYKCTEGCSEDVPAFLHETTACSGDNS